MCKVLIVIAGAFAMLSLVSLASAPVQAGNGATGTPSKYSHHYRSNSITEFSSSSARVSNQGPKR
jgi:hypothetical protein